jgi:hypothetical protein
VGRISAVAANRVAGPSHAGRLNRCQLGDVIQRKPQKAGAGASVTSPALPASSGAGWPSLSGSAHSGLPGTPVTAMAPAQGAMTATVISIRRTASVPRVEMNLAPTTANDMPDMALALIRAIIAAADKDQDEMTVLLICGEPAAVIAPYGHERRPDAAAEIRNPGRKCPGADPGPHSGPVIRPRLPSCRAARPGGGEAGQRGAPPGRLCARRW